METFKDIKGYEGLYQISNRGNVRSLRSNIVMKLSCCKDNYLKVKFCKNGEQKTVQVHRLVAESFIDNPGNKPQINHKDCNKSNNDISNLEWVTAKENTTHAIENGLFANVIRQGRKVLKLDEQDNVIREYVSISEAAKENKCHPSNIRKVCNGIINKTGGYKWMYTN